MNHVPFFLCGLHDISCLLICHISVKVAGGTKHLPHLWDLCNNEIVVRSAKHVIKVINLP